MKEDLEIILSQNARRNDFRLTEEEFLSLAEEGVHLHGSADNRFCSDHITIFILMEEGKMSLRHYGRYCALAHASAEIFCEILSNKEISEMDSVVSYMQACLVSSQIMPLPSDLDKDYAVLYEFLQIPMAPNRRRCLTLVWEAVLTAWTSKAHDVVNKKGGLLCTS